MFGRVEKPPPTEPKWIGKTISHKKFGYEDVSDFAMGKAGTNLLFHGDTSHPLASGAEIASMLPVLRPLRALKGLTAAGREAKAARAVSVAAKAAKPAKVPTPHEVKVREALPSARSAATRQKKLISEEKAKRVEAAVSEGEKAGGGMAGLHAEKGQLRGSYSKVQFDKLSEGKLSQDELESLFKDIQAHPNLHYFEKLNARQALANTFMHGTPLRPFEIKHLQTVFGAKAIPAIQALSRKNKIGTAVMETLNVPRALMATLDVSGGLRQGLVSAFADPKIFGKNFGKQFHHLVSEGHHQKAISAIRSRPNAPYYRRMKLAITDLGDLEHREEQFMSNYAEKATGGKYSPVRASGRAYVGLLDSQRADLADKYLAADAAKGVNIDDPRYLKDLGRFINAATGRGGLGKFSGAALPLNTAFFSPRLMSSRLAFLNPKWYHGLHPAVRRHAVTAGARTGTGVAAALTGAAALGASVSVDPRNSDFAKVKLGNTRIDLAGGFPQYPRTAYQIAKGEKVSPTTGKVTHLGRGYGKQNRWTVAENFFTQKFSPSFSMLHDVATGSTYSGDPVTAKNAIGSRMIPLGLQDAADVYRDTGSLKKTAGAYGLSAVGMGVQNFHDTAPEKFADKVKTLRSAFIEANRKQGVKGIAPELAKQIRLHDLRYGAYKKANISTADPDYQQRAFAVDLKTLATMGHATPKQRQEWLSWAQRHSNDEISKQRAAWTREFFPTDWLNRAAKEVGVSVPR